MPRLFIGIKINPDPSLEKNFTGLMKRLTQCKIKWVEPENFHLTLKFLGEVEEFYINSLVMMLDQISVISESFVLTSKELGYFGNLKQPRIIWHGFEPERNLLKLQKTIDDKLAELDFEKEQKKFSAHLTLGRIKSLSPQYDLKEILSSFTPDPVSYPVTHFSLIKSTLRMEGPEYTLLKDFELRKNK